MSPDINNRLPEEGGQHGKGRNSKVMLATQPSRYLIGSLAKSFGKLFFIQTFLTHKCIQSV